MELLSGFEVIGQLPELHPTNFQYRNPSIEPITTPAPGIQYFFIASIAFIVRLIPLFFTVFTELFFVRKKQV